MDLNSYLLGVLSVVLPAVILFFILPILEKPRDRFIVWLYKKKKIKTRKDKDRRLLDETLASLRVINNLLLSSADIPIDTIKEYLFKIDSIAKEIKHKAFREIKDKLLKYVAKVEDLHLDMDREGRLNLLSRCEGGSLILHEEIKEILSQTKKGKKGTK